jgi:hypothetical protein
LTYKYRWVYKRIFVADGNFKADHVRQKTAAGDVWLSEGGGMIPKRDEYLAFLKSAIERLTVSVQNIADNIATYLTNVIGCAFKRRHPVKIDSRPL